MNYIIYHPIRCCTNVKRIGNVYHDSFKGNQDPYIWNEQFLNSFCHITQIDKHNGQFNFLVSRGRNDKYPNFEHLYCDLVFKVTSIHEWTNRNSITLNDPIVDNKQSFIHHYKKGVIQHPFKGEIRPKKRITIKACKESSFQPQSEKQELIDIVPFLKTKGITIEQLRSSISLNSKGKVAFPSRPFKIEDKVAEELYEFLSKSKRKIFGKDLKNKYPKK